MQKKQKTSSSLCVRYSFQRSKKKNLHDCNDPNHPSTNLCTDGADYIRKNKDHLIGLYSSFSAKIAQIIGSSGKIVFLMEPDFYQYYSDKNQKGGPISGREMRQLFDSFCNAIKTKLPNAEFSWDISPWAGSQNQPQGFETWWSFFKDSDYISYIHTSGGSVFKKNVLYKLFLKNGSYIKLIIHFYI